MSFYERRRDPQFGDDLEELLKTGELSSDRVLDTCNANRHVVRVVIDTQGDAALYDTIVGRLRPCDVVERSEGVIVVNARVPDLQSAEIVSAKVYKAVQDHIDSQGRPEEHTYETDFGFTTLMLNPHKRVAHLITDGPISLEQAASIVNRIGQRDPNIFERIDVIAGDVLATDSDYLPFHSVGGVHYPLPTTVTGNRNQPYPLGGLIEGKNFVLCSSYSGVVYNPHAKTISIKDPTSIHE